MILEFSNLGDVGGHLHYLGDIAQVVSDGCRPNEDIVFFTGLGRHHHFSLVGLSVRKSFLDRAIGTGVILLLIDFETK